MDFYDAKMVEMLMEAAVRMPDLLNGGKLRMPKFEIRKRPGNYALFVDGHYECTTHEKDPALATRFMNVYALQHLAAQDAVHDVRRIPVLACIEHRKKMAIRKGLAGAGVICSTLEALADVLEMDESLQLRHLNDDWVEEAEDIFCRRYSFEYFHNGLKFMRTGIRDFTKKEAGAIYLPFDLTQGPPGREKVFSEVELGVIRRWSTGEETFVPKTRRWMPPCEALTATELRDRCLVYRQTWLGMNFGSRSGIYENLSHEPHDGGGWFDLRNAVFHRVPPHKQTYGNKLAPPVDMPPVAVEELDRWRDQDEGCPWVFQTLRGTPLSYEQQALIYRYRLGELGIDATGHILRHSCITDMIKRGIAASVIASVCGVSIRMLHDRYDHRDHRAVQKLAHDTMGRMF